MIRGRTLVAAAAGELSRLDLFVCRHFPGVLRARVREAIATGKILVNGRPSSKGRAMRAGDTVTVIALPEATDPWVIPDPDLPLSLLRLENEWLAVDKPAGMPVQPLSPGETGTLANALAARHPECFDIGEVRSGMGGVLHRIDTDTSGAVLAARTERAWRNLREQFRRRQVEKIYVAVVEGRVETGGVIETYLAHALERPGHMRVIPPSEKSGAERPMRAATAYEPVRRGSHRTLLKVTIRTGVTHQIRCHLAHAGHPVAGDRIYGGVRTGARLGRHLLHAAELVFADPTSGRRCRVVSPWPAEFDAALR